jgi:inhibitor of KinA sporulation pathway (predicted exonuclease)
MNYIVLDLEWNQPFSNKTAIKSPLFLRGEIVQIGAVKLDDGFNVVDTFKILIRPQYYTKMHFAVAKLTNIKSKDLMDGADFITAMVRFTRWCGREYVFLTWGYDDIPMLKDNMKLHGMDPDSIPHFYNVQTIFDNQILKEHRQCSLSSALESFGETIENAHDALADAYGTAVVCKHLNMSEGIEKYSDNELNPNKYEKFPSIIDARKNADITSVTCPSCSERIKCCDWVVIKTDNQLSKAYCECGKTYLVRFRFRKNSDKSYRVGKALYPFDEENQKLYEEKKEENAQKTKHFNSMMKHPIMRRKRKKQKEKV